MMLHCWYGGLDRQPGFRERHYLESYRRLWDDIQLLLTDDILAVDVDHAGAVEAYRR
jgi:hypothetical protein